MVVTPEIANRFIEQYKNFLLFLYDEEIRGDSDTEIVEKLSIARLHYRENRDAIDSYIEDSGHHLDNEMIEAIRTIQIESWVYLRDTSRYSIFVNPDMSKSFAVFGLTDRIREYIGFSGAFIKTGVFHVRDLYVCDGLISNVAQIGKNYKAEFNDLHKQYKAEGRFFR